MADRKDVLQALADDIRSLAADLKGLIEDPKERKRRERQWRVLYGAIALGYTVLSRRLVTRVWGIVTGERPPRRAGPGRPPEPPPSEPTPAGTASGTAEQH
jgi:hypothetical protein